MRIIAFLLGIALAGASLAEEITIAVASNFAAPMRELVEEFESRSGHKINLSLGSSGRFYAQILNGAPYHIFLSADQEKPLALEMAGAAGTGSRFTYASGRLVLWSPTAADGDPAAILRKDGFDHLALANPALAPYGAAAVEVLDTLQVLALSEPKWVRGESIAQAFQFVASGNADLGFIALSQLVEAQMLSAESMDTLAGTGMAAEEGKGAFWLVPVALHQPILQDAILLRRGEKSPAATELFRFLHSAEAQAVISRFGYLIANQGE